MLLVVLSEIPKVSLETFPNAETECHFDETKF